MVISDHLKIEGRLLLLFEDRKYFVEFLFTRIKRASKMPSEVCRPQTSIGTCLERYEPRDLLQFTIQNHHFLLSVFHKGQTYACILCAPEVSKVVDIGPLGSIHQVL